MLTERREHLELLATRLQPHAPSLAMLHGEMRPAERRAALAQLRDNDGAPRVILATGRCSGAASITHVWTRCYSRCEGTIVRYAVRLHRAHLRKRDVLVYDYVDAELPVLRRMVAKATQGLPVANPQPPEPLRVRADSDAQRPPASGTHRQEFLNRTGIR